MLKNVYGRFLRKWSKEKNPFATFSEIFYELYFLPAGMYTTLQFIGVKLPPYSTKYAPTMFRWSLYHSYQSY